MRSEDFADYFLEYFIRPLAKAVAEEIRGAAPPTPERVPITDEALQPFRVTARWVHDRARKKLIEIRGPRGARFVDANALRELIASITIRRTPKPSAETSAQDDAKEAARALAERRAS